MRFAIPVTIEASGRIMPGLGRETVGLERENSMMSAVRLSSWILGLCRRAARLALGSAVMLMAAVVVSLTAQAQTFTLLYQFTGGADGGRPLGGLVEDGAGNFYGTTSAGGLVGGTCKPLQGCGVVFKLDPSGKQTVLYSFTGLADGEIPNGGLILDWAGNLYGVTSGGGLTGGTCTLPQGCGVVFKLDTAGTNYTVLYSFKGGADGSGPQGSLVLDTAGNLYGATQGGGASMFGTIFKLDTSLTETVLYSFTGMADGSGPLGSLVLDVAGTFLYGTTPGTVFKVDATTGAETVLHSFTGDAGGGTLRAGVILDPAGNLYGTASAGGALNCLGGQNNKVGCGLVFKVNPSGMETEFNFTKGGDYPVAGLVRDTAGNLYGTTQFTGPHAGTSALLFKMDGYGAETVLWTFSGGGLDRSNPQGSLDMAASGKLHGATASGGSYGAGTVFELDPTGRQNFPFTVALAGKGSGTVTGNPGINCPSACSAFLFPGTAVTLTATAAAGSSFSGWSGPPSCPGTSACSLTTTNSGLVVFATFLVDFSLPFFALTPAAVSPGGSSTSTVNVTAGAGFSGAVALSCSVQPAPALAPTCSISPSSTTPGTAATLTVGTTGPTAAGWSSRTGSELFYVVWLPLIGLVATRVGLGRGQKKEKILAATLGCTLFAGVVFQVACGGNSSGGGSRGTPAGTYTITVSGVDSTGTLKHSANTALTVQ
jgi:uncharacterized repeat protein (TIGR03803 family)